MSSGKKRQNVKTESDLTKPKMQEDFRDLELSGDL